MDRKHFIYILRDPFTNEIRYVGRTIDPETRLKGHMSRSAVSAWDKKADWIRGLLKQDACPIMEVIDERTSTEEIALAEAEWLNYYLSEGCNLTNTQMNPVTYRGRKPKPIPAPAFQAAATPDPEPKASYMEQITPMYTVQELADALGVPYQTVRRWVHERKFDFFQVKRHIRIPRYVYEALVGPQPES